MSNRSIGVILLAVWLILTGLFGISNLSIEFAPVILGVLAIAAGGLILLGR